MSTSPMTRVLLPEEFSMLLFTFFIFLVSPPIEVNICNEIIWMFDPESLQQKLAVSLSEDVLSSSSHLSIWSASSVAYLAQIASGLS